MGVRGLAPAMGEGVGEETVGVVGRGGVLGGASSWKKPYVDCTATATARRVSGWPGSSRSAVRKYASSSERKALRSGPSSRRACEGRAQQHTE